MSVLFKKKMLTTGLSLNDIKRSQVAIRKYYICISEYIPRYILKHFKNYNTKKFSVGEKNAVT